MPTADTQNTTQPKSCPVVDFGAYRAADRRRRQDILAAVEPLIEPSLWPSNDYNEIGHHFAAFASYVRKGNGKDPEHLAHLLERYSKSCFAVMKNVRTIEQRMIKAEKAMRPRGVMKAVPFEDRAFAIRYGHKNYKRKLTKYRARKGR